MAEMTALGKQAGFNVGKPLMGKHRSGGWHACTVVAKIDAETYQVRWTGRPLWVTAPSLVRQSMPPLN